MISNGRIKSIIEYWDKLGDSRGFYRLVDSGLFGEIFPELTGEFMEDTETIKNYKKKLDKLDKE